MTTTVKALAEALKSQSDSASSAAARAQATATSALEITSASEACIKLVSGVMIEAMRITLPQVPTGNGTSITQSWPVAFVSTPYVSAAKTNAGSYWSFIEYVVHPAATGVTIDLWDNTSNGTNDANALTLDVIAIGRWK